MKALKDLPSVVQLVDNKKYRGPAAIAASCTTTCIHCSSTTCSGSSYSSCHCGPTIAGLCPTFPPGGWQHSPASPDGSADPIPCGLGAAVLSCTATRWVRGHWTPHTISVEDLEIRSITRLTGSTVSPPARQVVMGQDDEDTTATGSAHQPVDVDSSSSTGWESDESSPSPPLQQGSPTPGPQQAFPAPDPQQATSAQVPQGASSSQVTPPRSVASSIWKLPPLSAKARRAHLWAVDNSVEWLQKLRQEAQEDVLEKDKKELAEKYAELQLLRRRVPYLENEMEHGGGGHQENLSTVCHLQWIGSTHAYILFPNVGQTTVYPDISWFGHAGPQEQIRVPILRASLIWIFYPSGSQTSLTFIYVIESNWCQNNPAESLHWRDLHQFQF